MKASQKVQEAAHRFLSDPAMRPLITWWELQLANGAVSPGPVCPFRLSMAQGDRERLLAIRVAAGAHIKANPPST